MADTDISQAIKIIDDKIASLREARNRLASAFGIENDAPIPSHAAPKALNRPPVPQSAQPQSNDNHADSHPVGRKEQLAKLLQTNGAMSRTAIVERSTIPEGTVSYCLADKRFFVQAENGDWGITDYSRRGLERRAKTGTFKE